MTCAQVSGALEGFVPVEVCELVACLHETMALGGGEEDFDSGAVVWLCCVALAKVNTIVVLGIVGLLVFVALGVHCHHGPAGYLVGF